MLKQLKNERFRKATPKEREEFIVEAERMISEYGWEDRTTMPWSGCVIKVTKIINDLKDYDLCTASSRIVLLELANGLAVIMNAWEEHEKLPKVTIRMKDGSVKTVNEHLAAWLIEDEIAERI